jgi:hypothetical protein
MADKQIGVLGMEVYFPTTYVEQADLGENRASLLFLPPTTRGKNCASREEEDCGRATNARAGLCACAQRNTMASARASIPSAWARSAWPSPAIARTSTLSA